MTSAIELTQFWLSKIVIGLELCPFAKRPFEQGLIRLSEAESSEIDEMAEKLFDELEFLNEKSPSELSTTLIVYPHGPTDFQSYYDFVVEMEESMAHVGLDKYFQLVSFHPKFRFENEDESSVANLVNRSPYPILQIIRAEEIKSARLTLNQAESISLMNTKKLINLSKEERQKLFSYLTNVE